LKKVFFILLTVLMACFFIGCKQKSDPLERFYAPFSAQAKVTVEDSEYIIGIEKGGGNLVSVSVISPEALSGLRFSLGQEEVITFSNNKLSIKFIDSLAELIYAAFNESNILEVTAGEKTSDVVFTFNGKRGNIRLDGFSNLPQTLKYENISMEFNEFVR